MTERVLYTSLKNGNYEIVFTEIDESDLAHIEELTALFIRTWRRILQEREECKGKEPA